MEAMIFFMAKRCAVGLEAHLEDSAGWGKIEWRGYRRCSGRKEKKTSGGAFAWASWGEQCCAPTRPR
jgi:hypothetical protein